MRPISLDIWQPFRGPGESRHWTFRSTEERASTKSRGRPEGLPKRWSAQRKAEVVSRPHRGEDIGEASREIRVAPPEPEPEPWRREFLDGRKERG